MNYSASRSPTIRPWALADLLELAKETAIVLLAHDQSRVAGIVENRLAAFLVDRLISSYPEEAGILGMENSTARSLLQSGLIPWR